ncbi:MAG: BspA family leucine-rich repeat surface protein, partial [Christensenellales bacterium]
CSSLTSITFGTNFNTSNVIYMRGMFAGCSSLTSITFGTNFNTSNVIYMRGMFAGCSSLTSITFGTNFNTSNVTDMSRMFYDCSGLTSLSFSDNFNTGNVGNMSSMFYGCSGLTSLSFSDNFNISSVENMSSMFYDCSGLTDLTFVTNFDTSNVTDMSSMFYGCSGLTSLTFSTKFNTSIVKNMRFMFYKCSSLTSLTFSTNFNTSNVEDMSGMFARCSKISNLDLSKFNTINVENMGSMFNSSNSLTSLNLSSFTISSGCNVSSMFGNCAALKTIITPQTYLASAEASLPNGNWYEVNTSNVILRGPYTTLSSSNTGKTIKLSSSDFKAYLHPNWKSQTSGTLANASITSITFTKTQPSSDTEINVGASAATYTGSTFFGGVKAYISGTTITFYSPVSIYAPQSCSNLFSDLSSLTSITFDNFDTSEVTNMSSMFSFCRGLTSLGVNIFDTSNVTDMSSMFSYCSSLTSLTLYWSTTNVNNMYHMFYGCSNLKYLYFDQFSTVGVNNMAGMFGGCASLTSLNLSKFNTSSVTNMSEMFYYCDSLTSLSFSGNFNTGNVENMSGMFSYCSKISNLDLSKFNTSKVENMGSMFYLSNSLTSLNLSSFTISSGCSVSSMFDNCTALKTIITPQTYLASEEASLPNRIWYEFGVNNNVLSGPYKTLNSENTGMTIKTVAILHPNWKSQTSESLANSKITTIQFDNIGRGGGHIAVGTSDIAISSTDTTFNSDVQALISGTTIIFFSSDVILAPQDSSYLFSNKTYSKCLTSLTSITFDNFNTIGVTDMNHMFTSCSSLTGLTFGTNFNTSNVTDMWAIFAGCSSLTGLTFGTNFDTSNVTDMGAMFSGCSSLTGLDLSNFVTNDVLVMGGMFEDCSELTSLDITSFNTNNVRDMRAMFYGCSKLTSLDLSNFCFDYDYDENEDPQSYIFGDCTSLNTIKTPTACDRTVSLPNGTWYEFNSSNEIVSGPYTTLSSSNNGKTINLGYTLTIDPNGGTLLGSTSNKTVIQSYNTNYQLASPTRSGYVFNGWKLTSGSGSFAETNRGGDIWVATEKTDGDGTKYINYHYEQSKTTSDSWHSFHFEPYTFIAGHTYELTIQIRMNTKNALAMQLRHSRMDNDWAATQIQTPEPNGVWTVLTLSCVLNETSDRSGTTYTTSPRIEFYTSSRKNATEDTIIFDFDLKNLVVVDKTANTTAYSSAKYTFGAGNGTLTAQWTEAEARIGNVYYETIEQAFAAATDNQTITIVKDGIVIDDMITVNSSVTLTSDVTCTVKRGGQNYMFFTPTNKELVVNAPNVTFDGEGKQGMGFLVMNANNSIFTFIAGTITGFNGAYGGAIWGGNGEYVTTINLNGGVITNCGYNTNDFGVIAGLYNTTINMTAGSISNCTTVAIKMQSGSVLNISGGTLTNVASATYNLIINEGTTNITGGTFNNNNAAASMISNTGTLTINNGTFLGNTDSLATAYTGSGGCIASTGSLTINNGTFKYFYCAGSGAVIRINSTSATTTINGGSFTNNKANSYAGVIDCYGTVNITGGTFTNNTAV